MNKLKNNRKLILGLALILIGAIILIGYWQTGASRKNADDARRKAVVRKTGVERKIDFTALQEENPEVIAYIEIPGADVSYPILQSGEATEEDYYLDHTIDKAYGYPGAVYIQKANAADFGDAATVIYGHDMHDLSYFGGLGRYVDEAYFNEHQKVRIYLPEKRLDYEVVTTNAFDDRLLPTSYDLKSGDSAVQFLKDLRAYVCNGTGNDTVDGTTAKMENAKAADGVSAQTIADGGQLIVLSTCINGRPDNRRLLVAEKVAEKEYKADSKTKSK